MKAIARAKTWHRVLAASVALTAVCGFSETPDYFVEWVQPSSPNLYVDTGVQGKVGLKAELQYIHVQNGSWPVMLGSWGGTTSVSTSPCIGASRHVGNMVTR